MDSIVDFVKGGTHFLKRVISNSLVDLGYIVEIKEVKGKCIGQFEIYNFNLTKIRILGVEKQENLQVKEMKEGKLRKEKGKNWMRLPSYNSENEYVKIEFKIVDVDKIAKLELKTFDEGNIVLLLDVKNISKSRKYKYKIMSGKKGLLWWGTRMQKMEKLLWKNKYTISNSAQRKR